DWTKAIIALTQKHGERLAAAKANKAMMGEVSKQYAQDLLASWKPVQQALHNAAAKEYQNCLTVAGQAGLQTSQNQNSQNSNQMGMGGMGGMMGMMGGMMGGMMPGMMPGMSNFPPGSSADLAMQMLTANYRGSMNFIPVVFMWGQMIQNMVNKIQCVDTTSQ